MRTHGLTRSFSLVAVVLTLVLGLALSAQSQTVLIKMGDNTTNQGTNAPSPDSNGNYWNSVDSSQFFPGLTNIDGTAGGPGWAIAFGFETNEVGDTGASNGPAGPVPPGTPANCVIDANALGDLGIKQAVFNYYVNSEFELQNLYPSREYTLTFFGSHSQSPSDYTVYSIFTNSAYSMLEDAVSQYVQYPANPSVPNSNMVVSATVLPAANGTLYVQFLGTNAVNGAIGTNQAGGYLNAMQVTQGPSTNAAPAASPLNQTTLIQFGNSTLTNCTIAIVAGTNVYGNCPVTPNPDIQGHYWNSVSSANFFPTTNAAGQVDSMAYSADAAPGGYDSFNGPDSGTNGITVTNIVSDIATNALGYLGVPTAVSTYFEAWEVYLDGLDPTHQYEFNFFGSVKYPKSQTKYYLLNYAQTMFLNQFTSYVGSGQLNNEDQLTTVIFTPPSDAAVVIDFFGTNATKNGCLNAMSIVDLTPYPAPTTPALNATWLLNFGDTNIFPNPTTGQLGNQRAFQNPSPDSMGHYWNSVDTNTYGSPLVLTNAAGAATAMTVRLDVSNPAYTNITTGVGMADSYNGPCSYPAGAIPASPSNAVINTAALGYLGYSNAVCNYYVNSHFILQSMNPAHQYTLTFFGSHAYNGGTGAGPVSGGDPVTVYNVYSDSGYSSLLASTKLCVGGAYFQDWNTHRLAVIGPIYPSASGALYIDFAGAQGDLGYLNDMQIVDVTAATQTDPFTTWQDHYFTAPELGNPAYSGPNADPLGKGISNTNQFLAGFNPTNSAAYPHIISIAKSGSTNLTITYLGASGDNTYSPGFTSRTNVLEFASGTANGSYSNNFVSTGQINILSGGAGLGTVASFIQTNGATGRTGYYRVRVLAP
jgi:hypothetical protein